MGATRTVVANPKAWATIVDNGVEPDDGGLRMLGTLVRASAYVQVELHRRGEARDSAFRAGYVCTACPLTRPVKYASDHCPTPTTSSSEVVPRNGPPVRRRVRLN